MRTFQRPGGKWQTRGSRLSSDEEGELDDDEEAPRHRQREQDERQQFREQQQLGQLPSKMP